MKFQALLLAVLFGAASAAATDASVYLFQGQELPSTSNPPILSPEEARLVFAKRLGVSQYHGIGEAGESKLAHINTFGGRQESIFQEPGRDKAAELILLIQGVSSTTAEPLLSAWSSTKPAFTISNAPSTKANQRLIEDLNRQVGQVKVCYFEYAIDPLNKKCWDGNTKALFLDLSRGDVRQDRIPLWEEADELKQGTALKDLMAVQERLIEFAKNDEMNVMVVLMPESGSADSFKAYGSYEMPMQTQLRRQVEEPMTDLPAASSTAFKSNQVMTSNTSEPVEPITGVPALCYATIDSCMSSTNNCSGHGECYKKYGAAKGEDAAPACYACQCVPTKESFLAGEAQRPVYRETNWGGAACQKKDVSTPFWLFTIFTVVIIGLVSWSIGLLFAVGEEKLPGVIGAGVSSKTR
jgi:hypothetical protein